MKSKSQLPDLAQALGPLLQRVPADHQPLFIAYAERSAAERYRSWAAASTSPERKSALLACADREEEIASRVESLYPNAHNIQKELLASIPEFAATGQAFFAPYSLDDQFAIQAQGERIGAATWRSLAKRASAAQTRDVFLACAILEEQSAEYLESIAADSSG
jgi:rubrerythrin